MKLTQAAAEALEPRASSAYIAFDDRITGFGVRVTPTGSRSWVFVYRPGGGRRSPQKVVTLGRITDLPYSKARAAVEKLFYETKLGADPARARDEARAAPTVGELAEKFLTEEVESKRKPSTSRLYRKQFDSYICPALGSRRARDVTFADCSRMHREIGVTAPVVANRSVTLLGTFYVWAGKAGHVPRGMNPARDITPFREISRERFLSTEELARLGDVLHEAETIGIQWTVDETKPKAKHLPKRENRREVFPVHVTAAFRLLILTGCRRGEILNSRWQDIDWERAQLVLPDSKTGGRRIPLSAAALAVLDGLPRIGTYIVPGLKAGMKDEAPRADLNRPWAAISKRAGLKIRIHDLRHSFASVGAGLGLGLPIVGKLLGHVQSSTTARYAHLDVDPLRRATDHIGAVIEGAMARKPGATVVPIKGSRT